MEQTIRQSRLNAPRLRLTSLPMLLLVRAYQAGLRPLMGGHCRFHPSCSEYAAEAFRLHPVGRASRLVLRRLSSCHPWGRGGFDPVPIDEAAPVRQSEAGVGDWCD